MNIISVFFIAVGLSMDAFAVAVTKGMTMKKFNPKNALKIAAFFGLFQGIMPLIGWAAGVRFNEYVVKYDHWIALILLVFIGGKMLHEAYKNADECEVSVSSDKEDSLDNKMLFLLAVATSIDALAVGISFAFLQIEIIKSISIIAITTFLLSFMGTAMGRKFGCLLEKRAEIFGGIILCLIGIKIFAEHTGAVEKLISMFR